ncbi:MAG: hypothetical protein JO168_19090 [Solirubrobacterales bacterium]|nr:hypothetical protein [Solirubrobacterales bacterium]
MTSTIDARMTSIDTTETPSWRLIEALSDAQTHFLQGSAEVARQSTDTYAKALKLFAEPQRSAYQALQQRMSELLEGTADVARDSTNTYINALTVIAEQQRLVSRAFQHWWFGIARAQSELMQRAVEGYDVARRELLRSAEGSVRSAAEAGTAVAETGVRASATRSPSTSKADGQGPARWRREEYDGSTAAEIVARLPQLSQNELDEVESYEKAHQSRQTVLQKVASLRGPEPLPGYDELNVPEIQRRLAEGGVDLAARVRDYERPRKARDGVLHAADAQLSKA